MFLIGLHVYLVRRHGVTPSPAETDLPKKFFPEQVFRDTVVIFFYFVVLVVLAVAVRVPLGQLADPTDTAFVPRPEWYFLFLFQTLKFSEGQLETVGTIILPTLAILVLFLMPFIDRGKAIRATRRTAAMGAVILAGLGWSALTMAALRSTPPNSEPERPVVTAPQTWQQLSPEELAGIGYFRSEKCSVCHLPNSHSRTPGPDLTPDSDAQNGGVDDRPL